ncbi:hypothetical protein KA183_08015 [bacterium]|nr:hypothetical protein [bacterium]QQR58409.1 MAG: hypothetical protein IPG59_02625 [Candidatus Melainabacteria bacterium]
MRKRAGSVSAEIIVCFIALFPIFFLIFDLIIVYAGYQTNQTFSRDAARAASLLLPPKQGKQTDGPLFLRASQICANGRNMVKGYLSGPFLENIEVMNFTPPGPFGGTYSGTVTVRTTLQVKVPAAIPGLIPEMVTVKGVSTFPLTGVVQSSVIVH